jgi:hypothetical protein
MLGKLRFRRSLVILTDALPHSSSSSDEPSSRASAGRRWSSPKQLVEMDEDEDDEVDEADDAVGEHHGASVAVR